MYPRLLATLAAVAMLTASAAQAGWITRDVNLRAGPSTGHRIHAVLRACTRVDGRGSHRGWVRVGSPRGQGWVSGRYVSHNRPSYCRTRSHVHRPPVVVVPRHTYRHRPHHHRHGLRPRHVPRGGHHHTARPPYWGP